MHPVLRRVFHNRDLFTVEDLDHGLSNLIPPARLAGMKAAVEVLVQALETRQRILIIGDFDVDGATATTLALLGLRGMGAAEVAYLVPNRFEYGYGLSPEIAEVAVRQDPGLVITVDNGISSIKGVQLLKERDVGVIVTDHHLPGKQLPQADAIVNPNQPGCDFPSKALAGVGVMFYLLLGLRAGLRAENWFAEHEIEEPNLAAYLDLVALGTVADLVPLDRNNRILVAQGVARIQSGACRQGIAKLLEVAGRKYRRAVTSDLGFVVGPRLNAAGRLDDISTGIECLLAEDPAAAAELAAMLQGINRQRREIEQQMQQQAVAALKSLDDLGESGQAEGVCLFDESWHQGVTGLVASRIKERTERPVVAFAPGGNSELKGSARSIPQLHIRDALAAIDAGNPGLIQRFGGHAMAAGLSIARDSYPRFREAFRQEVAALLQSENLESVLLTDGEIGAEDYNIALAETLRGASPWGQGFPAPLFDGCFEVLSQRIVGGQHLKLTLRPEGRREALDGIAFRFCAAGDRAPEFSRVHAVYQLDVNEFRGRRSVQLLIEHLEPLEEERL
ncbi:MAG: single-stranded-DNA-specific exonuclease RecJ [Pseudomonadota bacterium]|nr:single-stranded-DNA-specific exonuclease RecJ [Pseudomonadota bacterium]